MRAPGLLVGCIFFVWFGLAHGKDKKDESKEKEEEEVVLVKALAYKDPKRLCRNHRKITLTTQGLVDIPYTKKEYEIKKDEKEIGGGKRGSKANVQAKVKPLKHAPHKDDPPGCGSPICAVIDRKVQRFRSMCHYVQWAKTNSRCNQVNYLQKGDCYEIIDSKDGATKKAWVPEDLDLKDCKKCKEDEYCRESITVNIDLQSLISGKSSAFGGETFNEVDGRMVGVPIEFDSVCDVMKFLQSKNTLNKPTQVLGIAVGKKEDIYPIDENSKKFLWTEWFDHDTPCNSGGDNERHSAHMQALAETFTGSHRICDLDKSAMVSSTQIEGGSEISQVMADHAVKGEARGADGKPFKQTLAKMCDSQVICNDMDQSLDKLPPPFRYGSGTVGGGNATCLDYKMRYACSGKWLYRPTPVKIFEAYIPPRLPVGPVRAKIKIEVGVGRIERTTIVVFPLTGSSEPSTITVIHPKKDAGDDSGDGSDEKKDDDGSDEKKDEDESGDKKDDNDSGEKKVGDDSGEKKDDNGKDDKKDGNKSGEKKDDDNSGEKKDGDGKDDKKDGDKSGEKKDDDNSGEKKDGDGKDDKKDGDKSGEKKDDDDNSGEKKDNKLKRIVTIIIGSGDSQKILSGKYSTKRLPDGTQELTYHIIQNIADIDTIDVGTITITTGSGGVTKRVVLKANGIKTKSTYKCTDKRGDCSESVEEEPINLDNPEILDKEKEKKIEDKKRIETVIEDNKGSKVEMTSTFINGTVLEKKGKIDLPYDETANIFDVLATVQQELNVQYFVDSPPLANIFAECKWMDWVSESYPNKHLGGIEEERRDKTIKNNKVLEKHVCGSVPEAAHYIDAVTVDDATPWHELRVDQSAYEVYKLSPFIGYICNDANMPNSKAYCKDMKVRYCCATSLRAQWGEWKEWEECTKKCGGGIKKRLRDCEQSQERKEGSGLYDSKYNNKCYGEDTPVSKKRMSEQQEHCNVQGCPVDFLWAAWSSWTSCSVTCDTGKRSRERRCFPAKNGGVTCPDREKNLEDYYKEEPCMIKECERFSTGLWTGWSTCSASCGKGVRTKERNCMSDITQLKVDKKMCLKSAIFTQQDACILHACSEDGAWSKWTEWSSCDHNCLNHPDERQDKNATANAKQTRKRHCNNPPPTQGGKDCERDEKYEYINQEKAEMDSRPCKSKEEDENNGVDWCPVDCVLTQWTEWSTCSKTCIIAQEGLTVKYKMKDRGMGAADIKLWPPTEPDTLPVRERYKAIAKPAKYGGTCVFDLVAEKREDGMLWQQEPCKVCKEHMPMKDNKYILDWPKLEYPNKKDPTCVGYCPIDCKWDRECLKEDCKKWKEDFIKKQKKDAKKFKNNKKKLLGLQLSDSSTCFPSVILKRLAKMKKREKEYREYEEELKGWIEKLKTCDKDYKHAPMCILGRKRRVNKKTVKSISFATKKGRRNAKWWKDAVRQDIKKMAKLLLTESVREVIKPVFDGLYGGKPCQMKTKKKKFMSIRPDDDKNYDKKKMTNYETSESFIEYERCEMLPICEFLKPSKGKEEIKPPKDGGDTGPGSGGNSTSTTGSGYGHCLLKEWGEWGKFGKCDLKCGNNGKRVRKRKCLFTCNGKETEGCRPAKKHDDEDTTDTHMIPCGAECSASDIARFGEWTDWTLPDGFHPCTHKGEFVRTRVRPCIKPPHNDKAECKGRSKQTRTYPQPECPNKAR